MIASPDKQQTLALAGLLQSAIVVQQLAREERWDRTALHELTLSILRLEETQVEDIYGGLYGVDLGLRSMVRHLSGRPDASVREIYQYAASTHQLSLKLIKLKKTADLIHGELENVCSEHQEILHSDDDTNDLEVQTLLSDIYSRTISLITPRIIVQGVADRLQDEETVWRVRTALFAGVRSAFLWHQCGGRRWHLLFNRTDYIAQAKQLLNR